VSLKRPDIALIQPPGWAVQNPPLGLALLKSYLAGQGISATVFDFNIRLYAIRHDIYRNGWDLSNGYYTWERESFINQFFSYYSDEVLNLIYSVLASDPRAIGFSAHSPSFISSKILARKFREYAPEIPLICGGPQVARYTDNWRSLLDEKIVDAVIFGEGEESLTEYLKLRDGLSDQKIPGVAYRNDEGQIIDGGNRTLIASLDSLPFADFSDFNLDSYAGTNVLPSYFSRGCINNCIFCTERNFFPKFRNRSGQRLFDEIKYQLSRYPQTEYIRLHDSVSNGNMKELEKFCDLLIGNGLKINWDLENAVIRKEMDSRMYKKLRDAGCTLIGYGLENPSKKLLKKIGKNACQSADFDTVISEGVQAKITIGINMMFGLPGETDEDFEDQLSFLKRHKKNRRWLIINPALNYCYIPKGSEIALHPDEHEIDLSRGELYWSSTDGQNNYLQRMEKFETFCKRAEELGYSNLFNITQLINKNEQMGNYYIANMDPATGLEYLVQSFDKEQKTLDLAREIISLYETLSLTKDDRYIRILAYKERSESDEKKWSGAPSTRNELDLYIVSSPISQRISKLNSIAAMLKQPYFGPTLSITGMKNFLKYQFSKWVNVSDTRYNTLLGMIMDLDNKISALEHLQKNRK
jgi:hypothetical protein